MNSDQANAALRSEYILLAWTARGMTQVRESHVHQVEVLASLTDHDVQTDKEAHGDRNEEEIDNDLWI